MQKTLFILLLIVIPVFTNAQEEKVEFTRADTLKGSINSERIWWDVQKYDITIEPDFKKKSTIGKNIITYKVVKEEHSPYMQIDLQEPLRIDSIIYNNRRKLSFIREGNVFHVKSKKQPLNSINKIAIYYHGKPRVAVRPPWDGGWTFTEDALGRPWMTVICQGLGASI